MASSQTEAGMGGRVLKCLGLQCEEMFMFVKYTFSAIAACY